MAPFVQILLSHILPCPSPLLSFCMFWMVSPIQFTPFSFAVSTGAITWIVKAKLLISSVYSNLFINQSVHHTIFLFSYICHINLYLFSYLRVITRNITNTKTSSSHESSFCHRKSGPFIHLLLSKSASALKPLAASSAVLHLLLT